MSRLLYLLICLSLHASSAHCLGITDEERGEGFKLLRKVAEYEEYPETSISSSVGQSFSKGKRTELQVGKLGYGTGIHENWRGANNIKKKDTKAPCEEKEDTKVVGLAGNEIIVPPSPDILQEATKIEKWKRQARKMLGSIPNDDKETIDSKENGAEEDMVVMDYAHPHRKPPIHNKET